MIKKIIPLIIIVLSIIYYIIFKDFYHDINSSNSNKIQKISNITISDVENFINENNIDLLDTRNAFFNKRNDLTNQTKLLLAFYNLQSQIDENLVISQNVVEEEVKRIFGKTSFNHENLVFNNLVILSYDKQKQIYEQKLLIETTNVIPYKKIISLENKNNTYIATFHKFYIKDRKIYSSYGDYLNDTNLLYEAPEKIDAIDYINSKYNKENKDYYIYKYALKRENGELILTKYEKE